MPKVKGPKDGAVVTAFFDGRDKSRFPSLRETQDLVLLSIVGNEFCQGEYLAAIVKQAVALHPTVEGASQGKTTFLIADEIYWHNLKAELPAPDKVEHWKEEALRLGGNYFIKHRAIFLAPLDINVAEFVEEHGGKSIDGQIETINRIAREKRINFEIVRWQNWIARDTAGKIATMRPLYESVAGLKLALDLTMEDFVKRHCEEEQLIELWRSRSRDYLSEESPAIMWLAANLGYNFVIYPGAILPSFTATKKFFIVAEHHPHIEDGQSIQEACEHSALCTHVANPSRLVNWLEVNFKRSHAFKPGFFASPKSISPERGLSPIRESVSGVSPIQRRDMDVVSPPLLHSEEQVALAFKGITEAVLKADMPLAAQTDFITTLLIKFRVACVVPEQSAGLSLALV